MSNVVFFAIFFFPLVISALTSPPFFDYDTFWVDPSYIVDHKYPNTTWEAQLSIAQWAEDLVQYGPWSM